MKKYLLFVLLSLISICVVAQTVKVDVSSSQVAQGEVFKITYSCNSGQLSNLQLGALPAGVNVEAGPYMSQSSSFSMTNGHMSSSAQTSVSFYMTASKTGAVTIPPAKAIFGNKAVNTPSVKINVGGGARQNAPGRQPQAQQPQTQQQTATARGAENASGKRLFIKTEVNKTRVFEQEAILLTYKIYTKMNLKKFANTMPDMKGFHVQELPRPDQIQCHPENGYSVGVMNQYILYPQQSGKLEIPEVSYSILCGPDPDDISSFFQPQSNRRLDVVAPAQTIEVSALPEKPANFSGGVGDFNISARVDHSQVKAGDPITLRVVVDGVGNLKLIQSPDVKLPADFDKYDPKTSDTTSVTQNGLEGSMIYDYVIVPRKKGQYTVPPVELTYFDIATNSYKTIKTTPIVLDILEGDGTSTAMADFSGNEGETDIRGIMTGSTTLHPSGSHFFGSTSYFLWLIIPILLFAVLFFAFRKHAIDNANIVKTRGKKANKVATKRLQNAANLMHQGKQSEFYDEVLRALWGYVGDKLNMPATQLSKDNIAENLAMKNINDQTIDTFIQAIDDCEYARYAPGDPKGKMDHVYESAITAITDIDNMLNQKRTTASAMPVVLLLAMLLTGTNVFAAVTKQQADDLYAKEKYQEAIAGYNEILKEGVSAEVYYNLGNAYFRTNNITKAILAYERAHRLSPGNADIRFNLKLAQQKTIDKVMPENEMFFVTWYHSFINSMSADAWAVMSIVCVILLLVSLVLYLFVQNMTVIKASFYLAAASSALFILSTLCAFLQRAEFNNNEGAVIISPSVEVKKTPADNATETMILHEGTSVIITDNSMKDWLGIRTADGREGWLKPNNIEKI